MRYELRAIKEDADGDVESTPLPAPEGFGIEGYSIYYITKSDGVEIPIWIADFGYNVELAEKVVQFLNSK